MTKLNTPAPIHPYEHQGLAVIAASDHMRTSEAALVVAPTGSGKTVMIGEMIRRQLPSCRVLVLQHMINLVDQNDATIRNMNPNRVVAVHCAGAIASGPYEGASVVIASAQTFQGTDAEAIGAFDMLRIDEAQHVASDQYGAIIRTLRIKRPKMKIFGVTATPERPDGKSIAHVFGPASAYTIGLRTLIEAGHLVEPIQRTLVLNGVNLTGKAVDGDDARLSKILDTDVTNGEVVRLYQKYGEGRKSIAFCCDVAHAEHLAAAFNAAGITSVAVSYKTSVSDCRKIVESISQSIL